MLKIKKLNNTEAQRQISYSYTKWTEFLKACHSITVAIFEQHSGTCYCCIKGRVSWSVQIDEE